MNFTMPSETDPRRIEVRTWLEANPGASYRQLNERGYVVPHWPRPWGLAADPEYQIIIEEELMRAGYAAPRFKNAVAVNNCGETLLTYGSEALRERYLPPALACEEQWCMLFSEPSGGSDLGALRTTARRDGDHYIVNGRKTWTSHGHDASVGVLVARTDPSAPKHAGLTEMLVDMKAPGVTVTPIIDMSGAPNEYNEVLLEDVRVPVANRLGEEGEGFKIAVLQLQAERVAMGRPGAYWGGGPTARDLIRGLIETDRFASPMLRDEAMQVYVEGEILRLLAYRSLSDRINAKPSGPEAAIRKMLASPHGQKLVDVAKRSQGPEGLIEGREVLPLYDKRTVRDDWDYSFWFSPGTTLGVGTQQLLKNIVAERVLGLPREVDPTARQPFNQVGRAQPSPVTAAAA